MVVKEKAEIEEQSPNGKKPRRDRTAGKEAEKIAKDLLLLLRSKDIQDLKQLTDLPNKLIDPISKGVAYYDGTLNTITTQCVALLDYYILKCQGDIARMQLLIEKNIKDAEKKEETAKPRTFWQKLLGSKPKILEVHELEPFDPEKRKAELEVLLAELQATKTEWEEMEVDVGESFFMTWLYNFCLTRRSQGDQKLIGGVLPLIQDQMYATGGGDTADKYRKILDM